MKFILGMSMQALITAVFAGIGLYNDMEHLAISQSLVAFVLFILSLFSSRE